MPDPKIEKNILQKLASLFYIENSWIPGDLIVEAEEEQSSPREDPPIDFKKELQEWLDATGVSAGFEESANEYIEAYEENLGAIVNDALPKVRALKAMTNSQDVNSFKSAADNLAAAGIEGSIDGQQIEKKVNDAAAKLAASPEFNDNLSSIISENEDQNKDSENSPEVSEENKLKAAKKVAFQQTKKGFDDKAADTIQSVKTQAAEEIAKLEPGDNTKSILKSTKLGIKLLKLFDDAKLSINNS